MPRARRSAALKSDLRHLDAARVTGHSLAYPGLIEAVGVCGPYLMARPLLPWEYGPSRDLMSSPSLKGPPHAFGASRDDEARIDILGAGRADAGNELGPKVEHEVVLDQLGLRDALEQDRVLAAVPGDPDTA